ncbi:MAG TPA: hypothetical protein VIJ25_17050 [Methylococcales bacterium]
MPKNSKGKTTATAFTVSEKALRAAKTASSWAANAYISAARWAILT